MWLKRSITFSYVPCIFYFNFLGSCSQGVFVILIFFSWLHGHYKWLLILQNLILLCSKMRGTAGFKEKLYVTEWKKIGHVMKYCLYLWYILFQTPEESWEKVLSFLWRLHIDIFFWHTMCISLLMTCLNQLLPASRNGGAEELKGKEKTNAPLPKYVWL